MKMYLVTKSVSPCNDGWDSENRIISLHSSHEEAVAAIKLQPDYRHDFDGETGYDGRTLYPYGKTAPFTTRYISTYRITEMTVDAVQITEAINETWDEDEVDRDDYTWCIHGNYAGVWCKKCQATALPRASTLPDYDSSRPIGRDAQQRTTYDFVTGRFSID